MPALRAISSSCLLALAMLPAAGARGAPVSVAVPLEDGRLDAARLLEETARAVGLEPGAALDGVDWTIDVRGRGERLRLALLGELTGDAVRLRLETDRAVLELDPASAVESARALQRAVETWIVETRDGVVTAAPRPHGLALVTDEIPRAPLDAAGPVPARLVVLVHGLDAPGWHWRDVVAALASRGHHVARFEYPNDGAVAGAADLLVEELARARGLGVERVDVVAHSMGGLVAREALTRPGLYGGDGTGGDRLPAVDRLIMLGTPNHGASLVRLRAVLEVHEHATRLWTDGGGLDFAVDGTGEAARDILPGSAFLRELNARPAPSHTRCTIVAGRISPVGETELEILSQRVRRLARAGRLPAWLRDLVRRDPGDDVVRMLDGAVRGLGDGCVTIDSARLEGVDDFTIVEADHLGMMLGAGAGDETPPAIPILLERLGRPRRP